MDTTVKLKLIAERAKKDRRKQFTALVHHINEESLAACYRELKKDKACGIDGVTVEEYGKELEENLSSLVGRMRRKAYFPQPVRRVYIPKPGKEEKRPLGIPAVEDKLVQIMLKKILEAVFEQDFLNCSYGYRPRRGAHQAINRLDKAIMAKPITAIVEVDIRKFFDELQHYWLMRGLEVRVKDPNLLLLIRRFLKAGIMEEGRLMRNETGTPQGGVISPLLANIYLHYILDEWFAVRFKSKAKGYVELVRYCDDFVVACERMKDAERFLNEVRSRLARFGLSLSENKTRIIEFGREIWRKKKAAREKPLSFDFLGFTHYCATSRKGRLILGHKTAKGRLAGATKETKEWLKKVSNQYGIKEWWPTLEAKLRGHYNYYGVSGNMRSMRSFYNRAKSMTYKYINRRSQRNSMDVEKFERYLIRHPLPRPKITRNLYTLLPIW